MPEVGGVGVGGWKNVAETTHINASRWCFIYVFGDVQSVGRALSIPDSVSNKTWTWIISRRAQTYFRAGKSQRAGVGFFRRMFTLELHAAVETCLLRTNNPKWMYSTNMARVVIVLSGEERPLRIFNRFKIVAFDFRYKYHVIREIWVYIRFSLGFSSCQWNQV